MDRHNHPAFLPRDQPTFKPPPGVPCYRNSARILHSSMEEPPEFPPYLQSRYPVWNSAQQASYPQQVRAPLYHGGMRAYSGAIPVGRRPVPSSPYHVYSPHMNNYLPQEVARLDSERLHYPQRSYVDGKIFNHSNPDDTKDLSYSLESDRQHEREKTLSELEYLGRYGEENDIFHKIRMWRKHGSRAKVYDCECGRRKAVHNITKIKAHVLATHYKK